MVLTGDVLQIQHCEGYGAVGVTLNQQEVEKAYWKDLESASSQDLQQYLEELNAQHYFAAIHPIVSKKLKACAAICVCEEE